MVGSRYSNEIVRNLPSLLGSPPYPAGSRPQDSPHQSRLSSARWTTWAERKRPLLWRLSNGTGLALPGLNRVTCPPLTNWCGQESEVWLPRCEGRVSLTWIILSIWEKKWSFLQGISGCHYQQKREKMLGQNNRDQWARSPSGVRGEVW